MPANFNRTAGPETLPTGRSNQQFWWIPVDSGEGTVCLLAAHVYRPFGNGPFPLVTINHGVPRDESEENLRRIKLRFENAAHWFVDKGFCVAVALRRGFGNSEGRFHEYSGPSECRDYIAEAKVIAGDIRGVIVYMQRQAFVDSARILIVGQSAGGLGALSLATTPLDGLLGVINFAGGRGSKTPGMICSRANLLTCMSVLGRANRVPGIWLFSENDQYFNQELAIEMFTAYSNESNKHIDFVRLPSFKNDGHRILYDADPKVWGEYVSCFIDKIGVLK